MILLALVLAAQTAQAPVRVGGNIPPPQKIKHVPPVYPDEALRSGVQGMVILEAIIDPTGKVSEARVMRSIPLLDQAAIDAVRQWEFTPTLLNGTPVPVVMTVTVNFTMQGAPYAPPMGAPTPASSMIRLTSSRSPDGMTTVWEITPERAAALPQWSIESPEPPVSIGDVARIAEAWLKARSPDVRQFALQNVTFARIGRSSNPAIDFWYYQVLFLGDGARPGDLLFRVVVLPDRTVVEPRTGPDR